MRFSVDRCSSDGYRRITRRKPAESLVACEGRITGQYNTVTAVCWQGSQG